MCSNFEALRAYLRDITADDFFPKCERSENDRLLGLLIYPVSVYYSYFLRLKRVFLRCDVSTTTIRKTARSCTYAHVLRIHMEHIQRQQINIWIHAEIQSPCPNNTHKSRKYPLFHIVFNFFLIFFCVNTKLEIASFCMRIFFLEYQQVRVLNPNEDIS
jgi:hypothetical protein